MKQTFNTAQSAFTPTKVEYYIRDASGNIMTTYMQNNDLATNTERIYVIDQKIGLNVYHNGITKVRFGLVTKSLSYYNCNIAVDEQPIYGSARLGTAHYYAVKYAGTIGGIKNDIFAPMNFVFSERLPAYRYIDKKVYELSDHLGNVHVTCSDRLATTYSFTGNTFNLETKQAKELSMQNYYAFGSPHPNTYDATTGAAIANDGTWSAGNSYRFGFNGMQKDDELKGSGNSLDFGARIYDSRLGRWLSLDPLQAKYAGLSPYNFVANNPIIYKDPDGRIITDTKLEGTKFKPILDKVRVLDIMKLLLKEHEGSSYNINYNQDDLLDETVKGETYPGRGKNWKNADVTLNIGALTRTTKYPSGYTWTYETTELAIATAVIHETFHALIFKGISKGEHKEGGIDGKDMQEHEILATTYMKDMRSAIKEYYKKNLNSNNRTDEEIDNDVEIISWAGLQETQAFQTYLNNNKMTLSEWQNKYKKLSEKATKIVNENGEEQTLPK